jgi:heme/copper-type cytochrome/quinol oxidase subunit 2
MSFPFIDFLAFVFIPLGLFFLFGWVIFYHLRRYGIKGDSTENTAYFFVAVLFLISLAIIITFFTIDWNSVNPIDFMKKSNI